MSQFCFPFWYLRQGYVMIRITGGMPERLLSRSVAAGVVLRDVQRQKEGITLWVPVGQVRPFGRLCRQYGCRFRLLKKEGFPFLLWRLARKKAMAGGLLVFLLAVSLSGLFVWQVEVSGVQEPIKSRLLAFCRQEGLREGAFGPSCDTGAVAEAMLEEFPFLRFVSIHQTGTRYTVEVEERLPEPVVVDKSTPAQVVAKVDALVTEVAVSAGSACVKEGDVVRQGDLLIDGHLTLRDGEAPVGETVTHAAGQVMGRFEVTWEKSLPLICQQWVPQGGRACQLLVKTKQGSFSFPAAQAEKMEVLDQKQLSLPFVQVQLTTYTPLVLQTLEQTEQQLKGALWSLAQQQEEIIRQTAGSIVDCKAEFLPASDGLTLQMTWTVEGDIGLTEQLDEGDETKDE